MTITIAKLFWAMNRNTFDANLKFGRRASWESQTTSVPHKTGLKRAGKEKVE